ncbi:MAG: cell division protein FtsW [Clostridia bacterium]|nr:cell division protein FtsW [Clostridia bacterium]
MTTGEKYVSAAVNHRKRIPVDMGMALIIMLLLCFGSVMVFTASYPYALSTYGDAFYFIKRQIFWAIAGSAGMTLCAAVGLSFHKKYTSVIGFTVALICLVLVLMSGASIKRWLNLGFFSFQPSELMKPMLILFVSLYMEKYRDIIKRNGIGKLGRVYDKRKFRAASVYGTFIPVGIVAAVCVLIMLENHFSGTLIMFCIGAMVIFGGGSVLRWFVGAGSVLVVGVFAVLFGTDYASERIEIWLHPERFSVRDETWQITQGLIAIGSGGLFGSGLGNGVQKHLYVSAAHNDFIFSIVCEELGLVGAVVVIALFAAFVVRAVSIAKRAKSIFGSLVALGIAGHVGLQAFLNIGVVTGTIPNTGVTLPFFSYGGSALVVLLCECGILLAVSADT